MVEPFDSKRYTDEMQKRKLEMIESKAQNKDFVVPIQEESSATVVNLFDALKKSVEEKQKQTKKKSTRTKTKGA